MVDNKASRVLSHQNLVVGLDASMEDKFSGKTREVIEKLLSIGRKMLVKRVVPPPGCGLWLCV